MNQLRRLQCQACGFTTILDRAGQLRWLQQGGHLRKMRDPSSSLVEELFRNQLSNLPCPGCQEVRWTSQEIDEEDGAGWGDGRRCQQCSQPIPPERLALLPDTQTCVDCQRTNECAAHCSTDEFCPRCGDRMILATRRSSLNTHRWLCPHCGR